MSDEIKQRPWGWCHTGQANQRHAVVCVNSHDALVSAVEDALNWYATFNERCDSDQIRRSIAHAEHALAKARSK